MDVVGRTKYCEHGSAPALGGTKDPDIGRIVALRPDLVVANKEENRRQDVEALAAAPIDVLLTDIGSLVDAAAEFRRLGAAVDRVTEAEALARAIEGIERDEPSVRAVCFIWRRPWMAVGAGTYAADVLAAAGFGSVVVEHRYPEVTPAEALALGAQVALLPSEPYPFREKHAIDMPPGLRPILLDGQSLTWYGPRTVIGVDEVRRTRRAVT